jgi:hypothetical protein
MPIADHRLAAQRCVLALLELLSIQPAGVLLSPLRVECESLARAIEAFHMEGIRFRMYNVDRLLTRSDLPIPAQALDLFAEARRELEAAGFHTRSHQAPG